MPIGRSPALWIAAILLIVFGLAAGIGGIWLIAVGGSW